MKTDIHPTYVECKVSCVCGNSFQTMSALPEIKIEICNVCHPFFTGKQKIIDTAGRVERFMRKYGIEDEADGEDEAEQGADA